jgi:hypothetical protein
MKERPILMNSTSVQAILAGRKTQTRRVIKPQPELGKPWKDWVVDPTEVDIPNAYCPHGISGDRLWCRETWAITYEEWEHYDTDLGPEANAFLTVWTGKKPTLETLKKLDMGGLTYRADYPDREGPLTCDMVWRSSIHMPRWASRILLEITDVRVERVQDISMADAIGEGCPEEHYHATRHPVFDDMKRLVQSGAVGPVAWFSHLWDSINAKRGYGWEVNPWCWVLEFKVIEPELKGMNQ